RATHRSAPRKPTAGRRRAEAKPRAAGSRKPQPARKTAGRPAKKTAPKRVVAPRPVARTAPKAQRPAPRSNGHDLLDDLIARARKAGADAADAVLFASSSYSLAHRLSQHPKRA